jgi:hypothetical protein
MALRLRLRLMKTLISETQGAAVSPFAMLMSLAHDLGTRLWYGLSVAWILYNTVNSQLCGAETGWATTENTKPNIYYEGFSNKKLMHRADNSAVLVVPNVKVRTWSPTFHPPFESSWLMGKLPRKKQTTYYVLQNLYLWNYSNLT